MEGMTRLGYTMLIEELEYLKTKTRLKDERFESVTGECVIFYRYRRYRRAIYV